MSVGSAHAVGSGAPATPLARQIDRWIFVFMAASFIVYVLVGFIPDSLEKMAAVEAGQRPPFPWILHAHGALMGLFLVVLLAQALLVATRRQVFHQQLGILAAVLALALIFVGFALVPTMYRQGWEGAQVAPPEVRAEILQGLRGFDNIMLLQLRIGTVFSLLVGIALMMRKVDSATHKRLMFLAVAAALPAAFDRMNWLPSSMPQSPLTTDLYPLLALSPMIVWDLVRLRKVQKAYWIWLAVLVPSSVFVYLSWDAAWWHETAPKLVGVAPLT